VEAVRLVGGFSIGFMDGWMGARGVAHGLCSVWRRGHQRVDFL
jgi:hypothetical protein